MRLDDKESGTWRSIFFFKDGEIDVYYSMES